MPSTLTYTGKVGPGDTVTSKLFSDVSFMTINFGARTLHVGYNENSQPQQQTFDMSGGTVTLTDTITTNNHVIAISVS